MSTRSNIVIVDGYDTLWFYRHSDGYPSVTGESLKTFLRWVLDGKIRDNANQAAGWLVLLGASEYNERYDADSHKHVPKDDLLSPRSPADGFSWKCGAYEPTGGCHGYIEFAYVVDLQAKEIRCYRPTYDSEHGACFAPADPPEPFLVITAANIDEKIDDED